MMKPSFNLILTADFRDSSGKLKFPDIGLSVLAENPQIKQTYFTEHRTEIGADQIGDAQAVLVLAPNVTAQTVSKAKDLLIVARFGVGYDSVDVKECTVADVRVTITPGAVD